MKAFRLLTIIMAVFAWLSVVMPARATIPLPDSAPTIIKFNAWRNNLETGDLVLFFYANIPYATTPGEPCYNTFIWRLLDPTGTTEYGSALTYSAFNDNGYGYQLTSMYFDAANVTALGITWGAANVVRLSGNPAQFATPPEYNFTIASGDYSTLTAAADVEAEMTVRILALAADLDTRWGLGSTYSLLQEIETGTVLSIYGQAYFRGALYGIQGLCPQVFPYVISDMDLTARTFGSAYVTTMANQWNGTWIATAKAAGAALFDTTYDLTSVIVIIGLVALAWIISTATGGEPWGGVLDGYVVLLGMTRLGFFDLGALGLLTVIAFLYGDFRLWNAFR